MYKAIAEISNEVKFKIKFSMRFKEPQLSQLVVLSHRSLDLALYKYVQSRTNSQSNAEFNKGSERAPPDPISNKKTERKQTFVATYAMVLDTTKNVVH